jgi:hypothetical protein
VISPLFIRVLFLFPRFSWRILFSSVGAGASPYNMGPASQGTPTPMMSPAPPGGQQDSMGYNMNMNGGDYSSSMSGSQVSLQCQWPLNFLNSPAQAAFYTTWGLSFPHYLLGYDTIYEGCPESIRPFWISREPVAWPWCNLAASQRRHFFASMISHSTVGLVSRQWDAVDRACVLCDHIHKSPFQRRF